MTSDLTDLPGRVQAELTRLRAERQLFTAEQERLKARLAETEQELRDAHAGGLEKVGELQREHRQTVARVEALESDVATVRRERDALRAELTSCREERDRVRLRLLDAELALAAGTLDDQGPAESPLTAERAVLAEQKAAELAQELAATHQTLSWRVTRPLRAVRRKIPPS